MWRTVGKTVLPRTSVHLPHLSFIRGWNCRLRFAKVHYNGNAYSIKVHTDSHTHYRVCRRFDFSRFHLSPFWLGFLLPFWCCRFDHEPRAAAHRHRFFGSNPVSYFSSHYVCLALDLLKQPSSIFHWERVSLNTTSAPSATCLCRLPQPPARNQPSMYSFFAQKWYGLLSFWALSWLWARML